MDRLKGFNAPQDQFTRHWRLNPFERPAKLAYDLALNVLCILMDRERLWEADTGKLITTVDELLASPSQHLEGFSDEPLSRCKTQHGANVAMTVAGLRSRLNTAAAANNLPTSSMSYLRRDFTQHFLAMVSVTASRCSLVTVKDRRPWTSGTAAALQESTSLECVSVRSKRLKPTATT